MLNKRAEVIAKYAKVLEEVGKQNEMDGVEDTAKSDPDPAVALMMMEHALTSTEVPKGVPANFNWGEFASDISDMHQQ